jgi:hypothetical protein
MKSAAKKRGRKTTVASIPSWDPDIKRWTAAFSHKNFWKCKDYSLSGWLVYNRVVAKYPNVTNPGHFFSLYRTSFEREFFDFMEKGDQLRSIVDTTVDLYLSEQFSDCGENAAFARLLAEGPEELRLVLSMFNDPILLAELRKPYREKRGQVRENLNQRMCRLLAIARRDLLGPVREALNTRKA